MRYYSEMHKRRIQARRRREMRQAVLITILIIAALTAAYMSR